MPGVVGAVGAAKYVKVKRHLALQLPPFVQQFAEFGDALAVGQDG